MSTRDELNAYMRRLERRLRAGVLLRGGAIVAGAALATTVVLILILNSFAFSRASVGGGRAALIGLLGAAAALFLGLPLLRLNRRSVAGKAESRFPELQQRLITFAERDRSEEEDPFLELLAADTLEAAGEAKPARVVPSARLLALAGAGLASLGALVWVSMAGPGYWGYGASLLWSGRHPGAASYYDIRVTPGDAAVRRNADQLVTALPIGVQTDRVRLYARYRSATKWQEVLMQPRPGASGFQFLFAGLTEGLEYYVEAGPVHSRHYSIRVVEMPSVKRIRVRYHYPAWAGFQDVTEEQGGDLRAVQGSRADLEVFTDRPLPKGVLVVDQQTPSPDQGQQSPDQEKQISLASGQGNVYHATIPIEKDGLYHVAAVDHGQLVRLSGDYFIEANPPQPPQIAVVRPQRDYRASPIEEVTVAVKAQDDYGLKSVDLHYSVDGGAEKTVSLLKQKGAKQADGSTVLSLEDFKLVPGDVVSLYATAKDARAEAHTDIYFVQADPFEREFSQSQEAGGGGGGGGGGDQANQPGQISQREKEIIAATWKQQGEKSQTRQQAAASAEFLSGVQSKLADEAQSLSNRMQSRELDQQNEEFDSFVNDMNAAVAAMAPAADKLKQRKWNGAMPSEQKALENLLRAEATFRQIEVAFGSRGGGGGGGGAGRDLASLFDLELDTQKNQYETAQTADSTAPRSQQIDDALRKLDELARRQQELANQQPNQSPQSLEQRWQQEMLRRNAEELQRQLEQLAQNQQPSQQGGGQSAQSQSGQQGEQSQSGGQSAQSSGQQSGRQNGAQSGAAGSAQDAAGQSSAGGAQSAAARRALDQLRQAEQAMNTSSSAEEREANARRAADRLREATDALSGAQQQQVSSRLGGMTRDADQLKAEEQSQAARMRALFGGEQGGGQQEGAQQGSSMAEASQRYQQMQQLAGDRQRLSDGLTQLRREMQQAERELAPTQQAAASKLRDALGQMESSDLMTRTQRSADWLRRGINPETNATEAALGSGFTQLSQQMHQAASALGESGGAPDAGRQQSAANALEQLRMLRDQLQAAPGRAGARGQRGELARGGERGSRNQAGRNGQAGQSGQGGQPGQAGQYGQLARGGERAGENEGGANQDGAGRAGDVRAGSRYNRGGNVNGGMDTGNNSILPQPVAPDNSARPGDTEASIEQELGELNRVRQALGNDPETEREVQELIREMQGLDPRRFPGNPEVFEQLHTQVLADVDQLELRLTAAQQSGQIRSTSREPAPAGYQDAVAEYFRQLSERQ